MDDINKRVRSLRKSLRLSQIEFAESLGVTQAAISDVERGVNGVSLNLFRNIVNNHNVNAYWLLNGTGEPLAKEALASGSPSPIENEVIIDILRRLENLEQRNR